MRTTCITLGMRRGRGKQWNCSLDRNIKICPNQLDYLLDGERSCFRHEWSLGFRWGKETSRTIPSLMHCWGKVMVGKHCFWTVIKQNKVPKKKKKENLDAEDQVTTVSPQRGYQEGKKVKTYQHHKNLEGQYITISVLKNNLYFAMIEQFPEELILKNFSELSRK